MALKITFTAEARAQFLAAVAYIHRDNPRAAADFRRGVERALSGLVDFPESGRSLPEFPDLPFREVVVGRYRFFYRAKAGIVWVVAAWRNAQLPAGPTSAETGE